MLLVAILTEAFLHQILLLSVFRSLIPFETFEKYSIWYLVETLNGSLVKRRTLVDAPNVGRENWHVQERENI
jgi:hypothetical protein